MKTILITLVLYFAFVLIVFIARFFAWIAKELKRENMRVKARQAKQTQLISAYTIPLESRETIQTNTKPDNAAALQALRQQRDIYYDIINDIDAQLDNAPRNREKLLKDKASIYSKLAIVESKINKLTA